MVEGGLRDQKRKQTAHALAKVAFDLTAERGLDGFTIDDVVNTVGVSRRTFANYFSCKEEAVTALAIEQLRDGIDSMPTVPPETPLLEWVRRLALHQLSGGMLDLLVGLRDLARKYPALRPFVENLHGEIRRTAQAVVTEQAGDATSKWTVPIMVGAAYGALIAFIDVAEPCSGTSLEDFVEEVFAKLRSGL
ncbi:TetR/AcrR family transcriptional regulator [Raineyella sp.]|uniref:HTH tetR-type domain-containing protein n=1 Tax=bioreactor metagenome TaxID=1076179 RepID=A0A644ZDA8_9ZZZZ|nr:TetR/AcrR family transcriptional regulator [Raineyella sp.]MEA5153501.1 TetR/AcrR family transcriptional regulator [Raineyella sp.]